MDELVANGDWSELEVTHLVPPDEQWAVWGVVAARTDGAAAGIPVGRAEEWAEQFRRYVVEHLSDLRGRLGVDRLTPAERGRIVAAAEAFNRQFAA